jgi:outer membrane protein assembly factor BamB
MTTMRYLQRGAWLIAVLLVAACSKDKVVDEPAKLTVFTPQLRVKQVWSASVDDKKSQDLRLGLSLSVADDRVIAAGHKGGVTAFALQTGKVLWRAKLNAPLAGGTAVAGDIVLVGASDGRLFALNSADGHLRWSVRLNGEILAPAAISPKLIAIRTVDGKLRGLDPADGHELWSAEQPVPRLSLRGTSSPVISGDSVLCGFDDGKVMAVNANDGSVQWEIVVTPPHGRTELERLSDIDASVAVSGQDVYVVGFQGKVAMLALETGQIWWSHEASSARSLSFDGDTLYIATSEGEMLAMRGRTGVELWRQPVLLHRRLSGVVSMDDAVVVADFQGYVHWLDKASGAIIARARSGRTRVSNTPVVVGDLVLIDNDRGQISVYRVTPLPGRIPAAPGPAAQ